MRKTAVAGSIVIFMAGALVIAAEKANLWKFKSARATRAKTGYDAQLKLATGQYHNLLKAARTNLLRNLDQAIKEATKAGELDDALKIRQARKAAEEGPSLAAPPPTPPKPQPPAAAKPPKNAKTWGKHHYKLINDTMPVTEAQKACVKMGGRIVQIESADQNKFILGLLQGGTCNYYWIGGSDAAKEGNWRFSDDRKMAYLNWADKEPGDSAGIQHWLAIDRSGRWHDFPAGARKYGFICEWD